MCRRESHVQSPRVSLPAPGNPTRWRPRGWWPLGLQGRPQSRFKAHGALTTAACCSKSAHVSISPGGNKRPLRVPRRDKPLRLDDCGVWVDTLSRMPWQHPHPPHARIPTPHRPRQGPAGKGGQDRARADLSGLSRRPSRRLGSCDSPSDLVAALPGPAPRRARSFRDGRPWANPTPSAAQGLLRNSREISGGHPDLASRLPLPGGQDRCLSARSRHRPPRRCTGGPEALRPGWQKQEVSGGPASLVGLRACQRT